MPNSKPSKITIETGRIGKVPYRMVIPEQSEPCPLVFAIPGFGGDKNSLFSLAHRLAARGLACVSFDPLYHGERRDPRLERAADPVLGGVALRAPGGEHYPPDSGLDTYRVFLEVIRRCPADLQTLLHGLRRDLRLDVTRAGVTGFSMGALASYLAFAELPALRAAVPILGLPTFARRWRDLLDECAWSNPLWAAALAALTETTRAHTAWVESFDPVERLKSAAPRALLAMSGDFDCDQPKYYVLDWYREMLPAYAACPDRLRWNVYPAGHTLTEQMESDAVDWFDRHLSAPAA